MASRALVQHRSSGNRGLTDIVDEVTALAPNRRIVDPQLVAAAARAWAPNTVRAFLADLRIWDQWCRARRITVGIATAADVAAYIRALSGQEQGGEGPRVERRAAATIARYLVNIGWAHRMAGRDDPTAAPLVRLELKAARKALGVRQRQARGIRFKGDVLDFDGPPAGICLAHLLATCGRDWAGRRDEALLRVAYDTGCRRSELVAIDIAQIDGPDGEGAGTLLIQRSKTDREGEGAYAYLSPATMRAIDRWRRSAGIERGPLFRRIEAYLDGSPRTIGDGPLHAGTVTLIYKRRVRAAAAKGLLGKVSDAELDRWVAQVSSHSIRVGVAQDNLAAGESLPAIMQAYRWRDPNMVLRYGAKLAAASGSSARMAKRFGAE